MSLTSYMQDYLKYMLIIGPLLFLTYLWLWIPFEYYVPEEWISPVLEDKSPVTLVIPWLHWVLIVGGLIGMALFFIKEVWRLF